MKVSKTASSSDKSSLGVRRFCGKRTWLHGCLQSAYTSRSPSQLQLRVARFRGETLWQADFATVHVSTVQRLVRLELRNGQLLVNSHRRGFHRIRSDRHQAMEQHSRASRSLLARDFDRITQSSSYIPFRPRTLYWTGSYPPLGGMSCAIVAKAYVGDRSKLMTTGVNYTNRKH